MNQPTYDTLILGQGLAGSALAWHLIGDGERVCVIDDGHRSSSSKVAAGLINPLAGMRFNRRPEVGDWLSAAASFYGALEETFNLRLLYWIPMLRLFRSPEQQRFYQRRIEDADCRELLGTSFSAQSCPENVAAPHGGFTQKRTGYVDLPLLLASIRDWLSDQASFIDEAVGYDDILLDDGHVAVGSLSAKRLVFCEGARLTDNPWFKHLPLAPEKGEILNLQTTVSPRHIINGAHWVIPSHNGDLRVGATHDHQRLDNEPTEKGRADLLSGFAALYPNDAAPTVTRHQAGVRPSTADRYPLIGRHTNETRLWVFNGFGARGALSIPWYAERMAAHLMRGEDLPGEADILRL